MEAYGFPFQVFLFWTSTEEFRNSEKEYTAWCKLLCNARATGNLMDLENNMIFVLNTLSEAYVHVIKSAVIKS